MLPNSEQDMAPSKEVWQKTHYSRGAQAQEKGILWIQNKSPTLFAVMFSIEILTFICHPKLQPLPSKPSTL